MTLPSSGPLSLSDIQGEFGGSNPIGMNEYYAGGGLVPSGTTGTYGAVPTSGQISVQNFYGTSNYIPVYIEELFSSYLYVGNNTARSITNGVNLSTYGGLVWRKARAGSYSTDDHVLIDTTRGAAYSLFSNNINAQIASASRQIDSFDTNGFSVPAGDPGGYPLNYTGTTYVSWTFRKQPKFFDIVTFTQASGTTTTFSHNLGATPGFMLIKTTGTNNFWLVYHTSLGPDYYMIFNTANQASLYTGGFTVNSTSVTIKNGLLAATGNSFVAYLFASNAGGFGLTGSDNIITCGSYTGNNGVQTINLGYEAQWVLVKDASASDSTFSRWTIMDNMRGMPVDTSLSNSPDASLWPNTNDAESTGYNSVRPDATGFSVVNGGSPDNQSPHTYIYVAIRRGPMKVPTDATTVFGINTYSGTGGSSQSITAPFDAPSMAFSQVRNASGWSSPIIYDRLRGNSAGLMTDQTAAELASPSYGAVVICSTQQEEVVGNFGNSSGKTYVTWSFKRAPKFFDEVCWTGDGGFDQTVTHNLGVIPTLLITKLRPSSADWRVRVDTGSGAYPMRSLILNDTSASLASFTNQGTSTTCVPLPSTVYGYTYVTYLFASCPGVSKVGSYTGTGATQTISCGFTGGARFVLIKRTDSTGDWYVWDTARGMVSGTDPSLLLNSTAAEVNANSIYTTTGGFQIVSTAAGINASGGTYIYLAIA